MESFFIVNTPYHILISIGLALQDKSNQDKHLILTADFNSVENFYNSIVTWDNNPFSDIVILRGNYQMKGERFEYEKINFQNILKLKKIFRKFERSIIYVFNDNFPQNQYVLFKNFQNNGINIYVEDGIGAYSDSKVDDFPIRKKFLLRVLFGRSFQRLRILGTYPCIHKMFAFHPEIVRDELRGLKIEKIPDNTFKLLLTSNFCHHFFKTQNIDISTLNNKIVIFIPHSSLLIKINKLEEYKKVLKQIGSIIEEIVIKYHPREKEKDYLKMSLNKKIQIFPRSVPAELLYMTFLDNKPKAIISDSYTTFINTTYLEDVKLISLMNVLQIEDNGLIKKLSNSKIIFPNDITDLFDILSKL